MICYFEDNEILVREPCPLPDYAVIEGVWVPDILIERYVAAKNVLLKAAHDLAQYDKRTA